VSGSVDGVYKIDIFGTPQTLP